MRTLYITTGGLEASGEALAGGLFTAMADVAGIPIVRFYLSDNVISKAQNAIISATS